MASLQELLNVVVIPTGRRIIAHRAVAKAAEKAGNGPLRDHVARAVEHDLKTRTLELRWANQRNAGAAVDPRAVQLDQRSDQLLSGIHHVCRSAGDSNLPGQPVAEAKLILSSLYPAGLAALVQSTHEEQATAVEASLAALQTPEGQAAIDALRLSPSFQELHTVQRELSEVLATANAPTLQFMEIVTERKKGQALLLETVARILGLHPSESPEDIAARAALLEGITRQDEDVRAMYRRRHRNTDLNPDTGLPEGDGTVTPTE